MGYFLPPYTVLARSAAVVLAFATVSACSSDSDDIPNFVPETETQSFASTAIKGPLENTTIVANGADGTELLSIVESGSAFDLDLPVDAVYPVVVTTSGGTDTILNQDVSANGLSLKGILFNADQTTVNINPLSTILVEIGEASGDLSEEALNEAFSGLQLYGFGLPAGFNPISSTMTTSNTPAVLLAYESAFEVVRRTAAATGSTQNGVMTAIGADLTDGVIDGEGTADVDPEISAVFNNLSGVVLLESLSGGLVLDAGGSSTKTLSTADLNDATANVTGTTGSATNANLPPNAATVDQAIRALKVAAASTSDPAEQASINATLAILEVMPRSEQVNDAATNVATRALADSGDAVNSAAGNVSDPDVAAAANSAARTAADEALSNPVPRPVADFANADAGTDVILDVRANDPAIEDGFASLAVLTAPENGTAMVNEDNTITYRANADFSGTDTFVYTVTDGNGDRGSATVTVTVRIAPVAADDTAATLIPDDVLIAVLDNDLNIPEGSIVSIDTAPTSGSAAVTDNVITYTPDSEGTDTFSYLITTPDGDTLGASVSVQVFPEQESPAPIAIDDAFTLPAIAPSNIDPLANDLVLTDTPLTLTVGSSPNATLTVNGLTIDYTPDGIFGGTDTFTYTVTDASGDSSEGTISVTVDHVPVAVAQEVEVEEDDTVAVDLSTGATGLGNTPIEYLVTVTPNNGTVSLAGSIATYTPLAVAFGDDSYTFAIRDADGDIDTAVITVLASATPDALNDSATTPVGTPVAIPVLDNDFGLIDTPISVITDDPANGTATVTNNVVTYTPANGFGGTETFDYTVTDIDGQSDTATITVFVDDIPVGVADTDTTAVGGMVQVDVTANDTGITNLPLTVAVTTDATDGTTSVNGTVVTYTHTGMTGGDDTFTYTLTDSNGDETTAVVTLFVDDTPALVNQDLVTLVNTPIQIDLTDGGSGLSNEPLTFMVTADPASGNLSAINNGILTYTPNVNFAAGDTFTYTVTDTDNQGDDDTAQATVTLFMNDIPVAGDDSATIAINGSVDDFAILGNDTGLLNGITVTIDSESNGTAVLNQDNTVDFTPTAAFATTDSASAGFTYTIADAQEQSSATFTVFVDDTPVANADSEVTTPDQDININVLSNDTGTGNSPLTVTIKTQPTTGSVAVQANQTVTYTPDANQAADDSFEYTVTDFGDNPDADSAFVSVEVDDMPVAVDDGDNNNRTNAPVGQTTSISVLDNDTGLLDGGLTVTKQSDPADGVATVNGEQIDYVPDANFVGGGNDQFSYTVTDNDNDTSNAANVFVYVDDQPVAVDDTTGTAGDVDVLVDVLANDTGTGNGIAMVEVIANGAKGTATVQGTSINYNPDNAGPDSDTFTYRVTDNDGDLSNTATVTVGIGFAAVDDSLDVVRNISDATRYLGTDERTLTPLDNDANPGDAVLDSLDTTGTLGMVTIANDTTLTYTPPADAAIGSTDSFMYTIRSDNLADTKTATVTVTMASLCVEEGVRCVGRAPDTYTSIQDAVDDAQPGDVVKLVDGVYQHQQVGDPLIFVNVENSGTPGNPITLESFDGENAHLVGFGFPEDGSQPSRTNGILIRVTGDYVVVRNVEASYSTNFCLEVFGSHVEISDTTVHDCWFDNINVGRRHDFPITDVLIKNNELFRSRHGSGLVISRPADPNADDVPPTLGLISNITVERNLAYNNGRKPDNNQVPPIGGDPSGGGNSDGFAMGKQCRDELTPGDSPVGEYDGVDSLCPNMTYRDNVAFGNIDDGFDTTVGDGSILEGNISFGNGPEGERGFKFVRDLTGEIKVVGNVVFSNLDVGYEVRFVDTGFHYHNTAIDHLKDAGRGHQIVTSDPGALVKVRNNLAVHSRPNNGIGFPNDGTAIGSNNFDDEDDGDPMIGDSSFTMDSLVSVILIDNVDDPNLVDPRPDDAHLPFYFVLNLPNDATIDEKVQIIRDEVKAALEPQAGSPLIDAGVFDANIHCPTADDDAMNPHDPNDRSCRHWIGAAPDIGAYEFGL